MQLSSDFMALLPMFRRYARALTGSQWAGDELVIKTLEWLGKCRSLPEDVPAKVAIYRILSELWRGPFGDHIRAQCPNGAKPIGAEERISKLDCISRQAFLLVAMEKFSREEASKILALTEQEFSEHIERARRQIAEHASTDILIIEDERFTAAELAQIVTELGHRVTGSVRTRNEAVAAVARRRPGLILSDILLADDSSGIDAVAEILKEISVPIIFITSCPERLLTGKRPEPTFLIKKPFRSDEVRALISQAVFFKQNAIAADFPNEAIGRTEAVGD
ncbi:MAG: response regulator [Alphaproteobacteria bacterium]|nr:response regulator [Alphaproteobacteria bacterium]